MIYHIPTEYLVFGCQFSKLNINIKEDTYLHFYQAPLKNRTAFWSLLLTLAKMLPRPASKLIRTTYHGQRNQGGFQRASAWNTTTSYLHQSITSNYQAFKKVEPKYLNKFQIWIKQAKKWSSRITAIPILLSERDIIQWQRFKTQSLKLNQLYL